MSIRVCGQRVRWRVLTERTTLFANRRPSALRRRCRLCIRRRSFPRQGRRTGKPLILPIAGPGALYRSQCPLGSGLRQYLLGGQRRPDDPSGVEEWRAVQTIIANTSAGSVGVESFTVGDNQLFWAIGSDVLGSPLTVGSRKICSLTRTSTSAASTPTLAAPTSSFHRAPSTTPLLGCLSRQ